MRYCSSICRASVLIALVASVVALAGCVDDAPDADQVTWHEHIEPILSGRCIGCHQPGAIGPFDLSNYEQAHKLRHAIAAEVSSRRMPPWGADTEVAYNGDVSLSDDQVALVQKWVDQGAPRGDAARQGAALANVDSAPPRADVTLKMPAAYTPKKTPDDYRCFILDWPLDKTSFVSGFIARPGNTNLVHHVAVFLLNPGDLISPATLNALAKLDADDPGEGYTCYGGPTGTSGIKVPVQQLGQWVPGVAGDVFSAGTGIRVVAGAKVVLQLHYNLQSAGATSDLTEVDFQVESKVDHEAAFAPWLRAAWAMDPDTMKLPAGQKQVIHQYREDPRGFFKTVTGGIDLSEGFNVHSVLLHMHMLGVSGEAVIHRGDGTRVPLLVVPRYDFNWQRVYWLAKPVRFYPGDELSVTCRWDNSAANQQVVDGKQVAPTDVVWGEGTSDEMCVANLYVSQL